MSQIPASYSVESTPSVISAGGAALNLNGLCLTKNSRVPFGEVLSFPDGTAVGDFFGDASHEDIIANGGQTADGNPAGTGYFGGYQNSSMTPGAMLFAQYPEDAIAAYLRGADVAALTLAQLQALNGALTVVMDGYTHVIAEISFAADNSFSAAASSMTAAFTDPVESTFTASIGAAFTATGASTNLTTTAVTGIISVGDLVTGTGVPANTFILSQTSGPAGGAGVYVTSNPTTATAAACTCASNVMDVTAVATGTIEVGQTLAGTGITASQQVVAFISGAEGGVGLYRISGVPLNVVSEAVTGNATAPVVTFDSVSGSFVITSGVTGDASSAAFATGSLAAPLGLTQATGAVLSQGSDAMTPSEFMDFIVNQSVNWASFFTAFDPDLEGGTGNTQKLAFAAWANANAPRYVYLAEDSDITATLSVPATGSLGYKVNTQFQYDGTVCLYEPVDLNHAAFLSGAIASVNFAAKNGRISFAYKTQPGLGAAVSDFTSAVNLGGNPKVTGDFGNGYNFVGVFSLPNQSSINFQRGRISGDFNWLDSYINQIWLTNQFQAAAYNYMLAIGAFPYTAAGNANFETAMADVIAAGLNFGAYSPGVALSAQEISEVNQAAGANIAQTLQNQGYYFQINTASPTVRASRGSPPITFWYVDAGSVQSLNIGSVAVQ